MRGARTPKCTVLLSLSQRNQRRLRAQGLKYLTVGFHVFQVGPWAEQRCGGRRGARGRHRSIEIQEAKAGSEGVERGWGGRRGSGWGPRVRVRRQLRKSEIQEEVEGQRAEGRGQRGLRKESEKGLEKRLRIWEWIREQRRHLRAQVGGVVRRG